MILIGENIHIISKTTREALENKDKNFVKNLIKIQQNFDAIDLNVGPAKGKLDKIFEWLCPLCEGKNISFDSSNPNAIVQGLQCIKNTKDCFINSVSKDESKLELLINAALEYDCNLIALAFDPQKGICKTADERMEIVFELYEEFMEKGIPSDKIFFDPLVLPVKADQSQAGGVLNTIRMIKESFEPKVNTIVGLSNISNGSPKELRSLINRTFVTLAYGAGLDAAIADAKDEELSRIIKMLEINSPQSSTDELYINLANMIKNFEELEDIKFDKTNLSQQNIIKATAILLNKNVYSDSFAQV